MWWWRRRGRARTGRAACTRRAGPGARAARRRLPTETGGGAEFLQSEVLTNYVEYTGGTDGPADSSLSPIKLGWVNNEGGSIPTYAPKATSAADFAVSYINDKLGGIDGHPLELVKCFVKNAEEEGVNCGQQFVNDDGVMGVIYGAVAVGANSIAATMNAAKPIIAAYNLNPADQTNPNTYLLFGSGSYSVYAWGSFGRDILHAKTGAAIFPQSPGNQEGAGAMKDAMDAAGIDTKLVGFEPNATDLTGALTAAGAQSVDMIAAYVADANQCLALIRAMDQLGIPDEKLVAFFECATPEIRDSLGGTLPKSYHGIAQSGDAFVEPTSPVGQAFKDALTEYYGNDDNASDVWHSAIFGLFLTVAQFMNNVGADNLTPDTLAEQAQNFKGPLLLGSPVIHCGKYPSAPAVCADGDHFFHSNGDGTFESIDGWMQTPVELQAKLGATPEG